MPSYTALHIDAPFTMRMSGLAHSRIPVRRCDVMRFVFIAAATINDSRPQTSWVVSGIIKNGPGAPIRLGASQSLEEGRDESPIS